MGQLSHMGLLVFAGALLVACSQPQAGATPLSTPTPAPTALVAAPQSPAYCVPAQTGTLQEVNSTQAGPYFVHHPTPDKPTVPTVIFLSGGSGSRKSAQRAWDRYLSGGAGAEAFRIVLPYSVDVEFIDEAGRTFKILNEVLACYGGDPAKVHIAGVSNGGLVAFALMLARPERFATLLGAPGTFPGKDPAAWAKALAGKAVFNGVGANDEGWKADVKATHDALTAMGVESIYVEFAEQGHTVNEEFDKSVFFEFWAKHS